MGVIQGSLNQLAGTSLGAAALGTHAVEKVKAEEEEKKNEKIDVENKMSAAVLKAASQTEEFKELDIKQGDINGFVVHNKLGIKPTAEYKPKYDAMKAIIAKQVLQSETYAKAMQNRDFRKRLLSFSQRELNSAMGYDYRRKKEGKK